MNIRDYLNNICESAKPVNITSEQIKEVLTPSEYKKLKKALESKNHSEDIEKILDKLYDLFFEYMPYGVAKAKDEDPNEWIFKKLANIDL